MITLNTEHGEISFEEDSWGDQVEFTFQTATAKLAVPGPEADVDELEQGSTLNFRNYYSMDASEVADMLVLTDYLHGIMEHADRFNEAFKITAKQREEQREAEEQREREEREAELQRRKETLMHELVGERVRMRQYRYKTLRAADVEVLPVYTYDYDKRERVETGEYKVHFAYGPQDQSRTQRIEQIKRLDVRQKNGSWLTVWDDGLDDLSPWERDSPSLKPVEKMYDGQLLED